MNIQELKRIVKDISFAPSNLDMGWKFQVKEIEDGFKIRTTFKRPDTNTGKIGTGYGRWMLIDKDTTDRSVVMTAWLCAELIVKHELMEAFLFKKIRIFDPHKSLEDLAHPYNMGTGRKTLTDEKGNIKGAKVHKKRIILG